MNELYELWKNSLNRYASRIALRSTSESLTYSALDQRVNEASTVLESLELTTGTKVAILVGNEPAFVTIFLACQKTGAVACPLNPNARPREVTQLLETLAPDATVVSASAQSGIEHLKGRFVVMTAEHTQLRVERDAVGPPRPEPELKNVAAVLCTSGTTGTPKAAMLTHHNLTSNLEAFRTLLQRWPDEDWLAQENFGNVIPLFHPYGLIMMTLMPLYLGGSTVLLPQFSPSSTLKLIEEFGITFFGGVPSMYALFNQLAHPEMYDVSSCRYWISGGSALHDSVSRDFSTKYKALIREGFGMLETSSLATLNFDDSRQHPGSVGPLAGQMSARISNDSGSELAPGEAGELWLRGPNIMKGYYRNPEATSEALQGGWLVTGDIGCIDEDGYLYLMGRSKEMMIVGGHNVYPREIENVLLSDTAVADAAVVAKEDPVRGERIVAFVVPAIDQTLQKRKILERCRLHLSSFKCPRQIHITDEIPRNASGKIQRQVLKELLV